MVVFTFVPQLVCNFLLTPHGPKYEDIKPQSALPQLFWFQTLRQIVEPGYMKSLRFTQDVCRWCWATRSHSKFIPEALDGVEVRALCRPVKVFHSEIQGESSLCNTRLMNGIFCCNSLSYTLLPQSWRNTFVLNIPLFWSSKGALCSFIEEIQTENLSIYNINEVTIQTFFSINE